VSPEGEFEPQVGVSAARSVRTWSWFAGALLLGTIAWWCARPRGRGCAPEPPVASALSAEARAEQDAWLAAVLPTSRGLDPEAVPRQHLDAVLVRAPHDEVLRWYRARGAVVADGVDGELVELGTGNALVVRLAGQGWSVVLERGEHGDWPAAMSQGLHTRVLVVRRFDGGPFGYELHDDGIVVERLTGTEPPAFRSTRRAAPASLDDDAAILDALLRELDAFLPALDFDECCRPLDRYGPRSPSRIGSPSRAHDFGSGPVTRQFAFARCSWITW
jgi:hypothetical protein